MRRRKNDLVQLMILTVLGGAVVLTMLLPRLPARRETAETTEISVVLREADSALWSNVRLGMEQAAGEIARAVARHNQRGLGLDKLKHTANIRKKP